jgi:hypothetical protein
VFVSTRSLAEVVLRAAQRQFYQGVPPSFRVALLPRSPLHYVLSRAREWGGWELSSVAL